MEDLSTSIQTNATSTEKGMETVEDHQIARKIDRLSLLPNELLDHIFDLAYSIDNPSTGALSKRLLPFHITGIYRRIRVSNCTTFLSLIDKVNKWPTLATSMQALELLPLEKPASPRQASTFDDVAQFLRSLTRLQTLDIGEGYPELSQILQLESSLFDLSDIPTLRHFSAPMPVKYPHDFHLSLNRFSRLLSLALTGYDDEFDKPIPSDPSPLPLVSHLSVSGIYADDPSIASLCLACPSLTHLNLCAYDATYVRFLKALPLTLLHLELGTVDAKGNIGMGGGAEDCGPELSRFSQLRSLSLDNYLYSTDLPSHLSSLQHLESLRIAGDEVLTVAIDELLATPTGPPSLRRLELYPSGFIIGTRLEVDENGRLLGKYETKEAEWSVPEDWEFVIFGHERVGKMREAVKESEVETSGTFLDALKVVDAYFLELANNTIYRCFRYKTIRPYLEHMQTERHNKRFPFLDLDSLDPNNLKLVKTDLPDEGWFALSLEAGDE